MNELFAIQKQMADAVRFPIQAAPFGIQQERLEVYRELVLNNVSNFVRSAFPVLRQICGDDVFDTKIRQFFQESQLDSPYFVEIPEAFMHWLQEHVENLPPFALELAHYEWLELELFRRDAEQQSNAQSLTWSADFALSDFEHWAIAISSLLEVAAYQFPVHQLSLQYQPTSLPEQPTFLAVYRGADDQVQFMQLDAPSAATIQLLQSSAMTFYQLIAAIAKLVPGLDREAITAGVINLLRQLNKNKLVLCMVAH